MTLRLSAALSILLGSGLFLAYLAWVGKGPFASRAERHLRAMKDRLEIPTRFESMTFDAFLALPHGRPLAEFARLEQRAVAIEGYPSFVKRSVDGDLYVSLTRAPSEDMRMPGITTEITPGFSRGSPTWTQEHLEARLRAPWWTKPRWPRPPRRTRISGYLLYDFQYDAPFVKGRRTLLPHGERITGWEIHPVTRIEVWEDSLARFVEIPR